MAAKKAETTGMAFSICLQRWKECLAGSDTNTIEKQIRRIAERNAIWAVVYESRKYADKKKDGTLKLNGLLHQFIDRCFWDSQLLAIRRLGDLSYDLTGDKSVYSLGTLLKDLQANRALLTRANLMAVVDLPYDYSERQKQYANWPTEFLQRKTSVRHKLIDGYCGNDPDIRTPDDIVGKAFLEKWVGGIQTIVTKFANKMVAHAATPKSRGRLPTVRYCDIDRTWRKLVGISQDIGKMLGIAVYIPGSYSGDTLEDIEVPLVPANRKQQMYQLFEDCMKCKSPFGDQE